MGVKKEDFERVLIKLGEFHYNYKKVQKIADDHNLPIEKLSIGDKTYYEYIQESIDYYIELDTLLESAKETIIDELDDKFIDLLSKIDRIEVDTVQDYYMMEKYSSLLFLLERAKNIKPLYTNRRVPAFIKRKYREAVLCFFDGRFDSCCAMCRSITEIFFKDLCQRKLGATSETYDDKHLAFLINICAKFKFLKDTELKAAIRIKKTGNESLHSRKSKSEKDALASIEDVQKIVKVIDY